MIYFCENKNCPEYNKEEDFPVTTSKFIDGEIRAIETLCKCGEYMTRKKTNNGFGTAVGTNKSTRGRHYYEKRADKY